MTMQPKDKYNIRIDRDNCGFNAYYIKFAYGIPLDKLYVIDGYWHFKDEDGTYKFISEYPIEED